MYTFISVLIGLLACGLFFNNNPIGILALIIGGLVFIRGNRKSKQKREEQRHREMMEALQKQK